MTMAVISPTALLVTTEQLLIYSAARPELLTECREALAWGGITASKRKEWEFSLYCLFLQTMDHASPAPVTLLH